MSLPDSAGSRRCNKVAHKDRDRTMKSEVFRMGNAKTKIELYILNVFRVHNDIEADLFQI